ncbi:MAG TPA: nicotinamide-nucleotide adenylyltransferase [Thermoplasmatales archaeon]|nr:nicotinamide-nucleotide adenylyltransferase [Thermoplasmatales archaeon]
MIALFIGRFQPFHMGHLRVIKEYSLLYDKIAIGIGSSQYHHTKENPFTVEERERMIRDSLKKEEIDNYEIYCIPDIHNYPKWVSHVESIVPEFDVVLARNPLTVKLFKDKGYKVIEPPQYYGNECSGSEIRKRIAEDEKWKHLVPDAVIKVIEEIGGVERIKRLYME